MTLIQESIKLYANGGVNAKTNRTRRAKKKQRRTKKKDNTAEKEKNNVKAKQGLSEYCIMEG